MIEIFEPGDTKQFTFQSSVAPDAAPSVALYATNGSSETLVASMTSAQSDTMHYYGMWTTPANSDGIFIVEWKAQSTVGGTAYPFVKRSLFNVAKTRSPR